ncbi:MAG TPA: hypothetical protein VKR58_00855 [Aquella sp.]|nr:hypothetical protein [Aquella sp.]
MEKALRYFSLTTLILKSGQIVGKSDHVIKGVQNTPNHGFDKIKNSVKSKLIPHYTTDRIDIIFQNILEITKDDYAIKWRNLNSSIPE